MILYTGPVHFSLFYSKNFFPFSSQISLRLGTYVQNVYEMVVSNNINWGSVLVNTAKISLY